MAGLRERRALLALASVPHMGPVAIQRVLAELGRGEGLTRFFDLPPAELARKFRLRKAAVEALCERGEQIRAEAARLERELRERDVHWLVATEAGFPRRLREAPWSPPPLLFTRGNEELLERPAVAFLNSGDAPPRALEVTDALADRVAARGVTVVSGHNTPGYKAAAVAPVRHGAPRVLVLDRGLISASEEAFDREPVPAARVWSPEWDDLAGLALSPFRPRDPWVQANSRRRDELVAALATALVAIHVRPGGTMERIGRAAMPGGTWLGVWTGSEAAGSEALLESPGSRAQALTSAAGLEAAAQRIVEAAEAGTGERAAPGRAAHGWVERERQFLYSLLERATGGLLALERFLDFGDLDRWPPAALPAGTADTAVRDAAGLRDARPALQPALEALAEGGWLAARVDARALAVEEDASLRPWLTGRGWVAATVALPPREGAVAVSALLFRKGTAPPRAVLAVQPEAPIRDAAAHRQYLAQARASVQAHLTRSG